MNRMLGVTVLVVGTILMDEPITSRGYTYIEENGKELRVPILNGYFPKITISRKDADTQQVDYDFTEHKKFNGKIYALHPYEVAKETEKADDKKYPPPMRAKKEPDNGWMVYPKDFPPGIPIGPTYYKK